MHLLCPGFAPTALLSRNAQSLPLGVGGHGDPGENGPAAAPVPARAPGSTRIVASLVTVLTVEPAVLMLQVEN